MKNIYKFILSIIIVVAAIGFIWWQYNKKGIVKSQIEKALVKGTDSTYYIHYDSSSIDELAGSATFFNIVLQSDSLQRELYTGDTSGFSTTIFNVHVERLSISGANIPSFLQKNTIEANSIEIVRPVITIINTGKEEKTSFTAADTLALYKKITGKFKSIQAKEIKITAANIAFARGEKSAHTILQGVNIVLQNLKIDSTRNYDNIVSYFIKDVVATVKNVSINNEKANRLLVLEGVEYNAPKRFLAVKKITQTNIKTGKNILTLINNRVEGLSPNAFIVNKLIIADSLISAGGAILINRKTTKGGDGQTIEIDNEFFNKVIVKNIRLGNTALTFYNPEKAKEKPLVLKNVKFNAANIDSIYAGTNLVKLLGNSQWYLATDGVSFATADKMYNINIGPFKIDKNKNKILVNYIAVKPTMSEAAFVQSLKYQKDQFNINVKKIVLDGVDIIALIEKESIIAQTITLQPTIKVFNDKTVQPDTASKIGKYPHQSILKLAIPIYIKKVTVSNGYISYRERGAISKQVGDVFFNTINGTILNVTNMEHFLKKNSTMTASFNTRFLNITQVSSQWKMPMNSAEGAFSVNGQVDGFNATKLNPIIEPLGMGSVKSGNIKSYSFNLQGNDYKGMGDAILLYDDLKLNLLKNKDDDLKKKTLKSFVANIFIKNQNPSNGTTRKAAISFDRIMTKSFFNLVWKSIFDGAKKSIK